MSYVRWSHSDWYIYESSYGIEFNSSSGTSITLPSDALDILLASMSKQEIVARQKTGKRLLKEWLDAPENIKWKRADTAMRGLTKPCVCDPKTGIYDHPAAEGGRCSGIGPTPGAEPSSPRFTELPEGTDFSSDPKSVELLEQYNHAHHDHAWGEPCDVPPTPPSL